MLLFRGPTAVSFHSWQSFSISFFHVSLGLPGPHPPSTYISHAVLTAPLECSTCPNQQILLYLKMRLRCSSLNSSSLDLTVATSSGMILQIYLIMAKLCGCKQRQDPCKGVGRLYNITGPFSNGHIISPAASKVQPF